MMILNHNTVSMLSSSISVILIIKNNNTGELFLVVRHLGKNLLPSIISMPYKTVQSNRIKKASKTMSIVFCLHVKGTVKNKKL